PGARRAVAAAVAAGSAAVVHRAGEWRRRAGAATARLAEAAAATGGCGPRLAAAHGARDRLLVRVRRTRLPFVVVELGTVRLFGRVFGQKAVADRVVRILVRVVVVPQVLGVVALIVVARALIAQA